MLEYKMPYSAEIKQAVISEKIVNKQGLNVYKNHNVDILYRYSSHRFKTKWDDSLG